VTDDGVGEQAPFHQLNQKPHGSPPLDELSASLFIENRDPEDNTRRIASRRCRILKMFARFWTTSPVPSTLQTRDLVTPEAATFAGTSSWNCAAASPSMTSSAAKCGRHHEQGFPHHEPESVS